MTDTELKAHHDKVKPRQEEFEKKFTQFRQEFSDIFDFTNYHFAVRWKELPSRYYACGDSTPQFTMSLMLLFSDILEGKTGQRIKTEGDFFIREE